MNPIKMWAVFTNSRSLLGFHAELEDIAKPFIKPILWGSVHKEHGEAMDDFVFKTILREVDRRSIDERRKWDIIKYEWDKAKRIFTAGDLGAFLEIRPVWVSEEAPDGEA